MSFSPDTIYSLLDSLPKNDFCLQCTICLSHCKDVHKIFREDEFHQASDLSIKLYDPPPPNDPRAEHISFLRGRVEGVCACACVVQTDLETDEISNKGGKGGRERESGRGEQSAHGSDDCMGRRRVGRHLAPS